jgi:glutathione S-transferase
MATLQILGAAPSNFVWAARIACEEKGVPYELVQAAPHSPDILAINPVGKMPAMRHGDVALFETKAICTYVDHAFPGPALTPADPVGMAEVEQWVSCINTSIDPVLMRQYALGYFFPGTPDKSPNRAVIDPALPKMEKFLTLLDATVAKTCFLVGDKFTFADMLIVPILHYMRKLPESAAMLTKLPALSAYAERHLARPSVAATTPPPPPAR